ncbi:HECT-like ubiquitin-conjugating enzyme-binding-domain-containing protein [Boeremia exigua]|uniref:HECT-like ubiquitin-conjugating enzyme-binding-domain-containing protein n=1 Tax=Boeremia exigua TaxID=749465 RepID=UPI001E8E35F2|nr:HECT-like ubiquitin-conjugating enzyme-binding-domain-containing protein [Boeremia exigua]KAH6638098.1 HECT-like ubiquitin-conjugating enzyme-binding-domain-containing protein [Boeremia exigua]
MAVPTLPESAYSALGLPPSVVRILMNPKPPPPPPLLAPELHQNETDFAQRLPENGSHIMLYAELLLHVRTITLFASLRSNHMRGTKVLLNAAGNVITVSHEGYSATIRLPVKVDGKGDAALELPAQPPSKELTLRLQLEEQDDSDMLGLMAESRKANIVPWDGVALSKQDGIELRCKNCEGVLLERGAVREWKDLPNENWAEMMDFWHCHKPDEHHLHDHTHEVGGQKGYAAGNRLQAAQGVGFVDLTGFLLKTQDCVGAKVSSEEALSDVAVTCKHCGHTLGKQDTAADGWRIWKWCLSISSGLTASPSYSTYSVQKWISARLLYLIDNVGVRKFHIHHPPSPTVSTAAATSPSPTPSILVWVFTPDLMFSSSIVRPHRTDPTRAIKCFFQKQTWAPLQPGEPESATIEDVEFPAELYEELEKSLDESQDVVPPTARKFQGWDVGLLERFDVGEEVLEEQDGAAEAMEGVEGLGLGDERERRGRELRRSLSQESLD